MNELEKMLENVARECTRTHETTNVLKRRLGPLLEAGQAAIDACKAQHEDADETIMAWDAALAAAREGGTDLSFKTLFQTWEDYALGMAILAMCSIPVFVIWTIVHFVRKWW